MNLILYVLLSSDTTTEDFQSCANDQDSSDSDELADDDIAQGSDQNDTIEKQSAKKRNAADAIARDKAVRRKTANLSNKEIALKSSEALASAIKDVYQSQSSNRKSDLLLWFEHETKERDKDRELEKIKLEMEERERKRRYEIEVMRLRNQAGGQMLFGFPQGQMQPQNIAQYPMPSGRNMQNVSQVSNQDLGFPQEINNNPS